MEQELQELKSRALEAIKTAGSSNEMEQVKVRFFGKKGELTQLLRGMSALSPEERPIYGQKVNALREELEEEYKSALARITEKETNELLVSEKIDVTLPAERPVIGKMHPITTVLNDALAVFTSMGFKIEEGREIETDYYNFQALNMPLDHPARDMQDTFYITDNFLLRTQTSAAQARVMENSAPPIRIVSPGRVFRADEVDATHSPIFHQLEGLVVDKGLSMSDLRGTLDIFAKSLYGSDTKTRFRPSFFPFTEPSAEVDVSCSACKGKGCKICKDTGWIEILGCGMVHPKVLANFSIDPEFYSGFAFGLGLDRIAVTRYGISDMRLLFENDMRFLRQF